MGGWLETDNRAISVQLDLTGTLTGTELGKIYANPLLDMLDSAYLGVQLGPVNCGSAHAQMIYI